MFLQLSLALTLLGAQDEAPRLRTILPNRSVILVERMPGAETMSVQLFASARDVPETPETHGHRHLLEHLILKGTDQKLDLRMEQQGMYFTGRTLRDAMQIEVMCEAKQLSQALTALNEILRPIKISEQDLATEHAILRQELAVQGDALRLSRAAWQHAFGEQGLEPFGSFGSIAKATPEALASLQRRLFAGHNLVLVITGDVNLEDATQSAKPLMLSAPEAEPAEWQPRSTGRTGRTEAEDAFGEARAALVSGYREPSTIWTLAAAFAIGTRLDDAFVIYTPTTQPGLVLLGRTTAQSGVGLFIDGLQEADLAQLYFVGKQMARAWVQRQLGTPAGNASLRGLLMAQGYAERPEVMLENIEAMGWPQFKQGVAMFAKENCVVTVGVRR